MHTELEPSLIAAVEASKDTRTDIGGRRFDAWVRRLQRLLQGQLFGAELQRRVERHAQRIDNITADELAAILRITPDEIPAAGLAEDWLRTQRELAQGMANDWADGVTAVLREAPVGIRAEALIGQLVERAGVSVSRAELIAENETINLYSRINQERQAGLGIKRYRWSSSRDEKVRPWHAALNGTPQSWDGKGPVGGGTRSHERGHPGLAIRCRCSATPALD